VELEVPSYAPQGGNTVPHSSSEDYIEEINPNIYDILNSKEHQTSDSYSIACDRHAGQSRSLHVIPLMITMV